jgi:phosphatidate phosphatase APP1
VNVSHSPDAPQPALPRLHRAARLEDAVGGVIERTLRRRGWRPRVLTYTGYGADGWVRVLGRVLLTPPGTRSRDVGGGRGWRRFLSAGVAGVPVTIDVGDQCHQVVSARGGYLDVRLTADLPAGWAAARLSADGSPPCEAPLRVVDAAARLGVVSDIDDTVVVTALPRPLLAFWNTFVRREDSRRPVPGMAQLYAELLAQDKHAPVIYLSTGAWNTAPALTRFLERHGYPPGPLLMTDWGPTADGWFRSGQAHKRTELRRLLEELPGLQWILVGDDGQHDPDLYTAAAVGAPGRVRVVAIRQLTATQQVLTHGTPDPMREKLPTVAAPEVRAPDGFGLLELLRSRGLLSGSGQS